MKVHTNLTAIRQKNVGEYNPGISMTLPDQAISPAELLRRYATGVPLGFRNVEPVYDDEHGEVPELYKMSKMDKLHAMQEGFHDLQQKKDVYDTYLKEQQQKAALEAAEKQQQQDNSLMASQAQHSEAQDA